MVAGVRKAHWVHYLYYSHTLYLVVKDYIKALPDLLHIQERCSALVAFFQPKCSREAQKNLEIAEAFYPQTNTIS